MVCVFRVDPFSNLLTSQPFASSLDSHHVCCERRKKEQCTVTKPKLLKMRSYFLRAVVAIISVQVQGVARAQYTVSPPKSILDFGTRNLRSSILFCVTPVLP